MEDFRLKVFVTVAEKGSFTAAAAELGVSQPAVSQNIAELEKLCDARLFVRSRGEVTLTDKGALLLEYARKILFWYSRIDGVFVQKTEAPEEPTLLNISEDRQAEVSVVDGQINIKFI